MQALNSTNIRHPELWKKILEIDFNDIQDRLSSKLCWTTEETLEISTRYRGFLYLCAAYNERPLAPYGDLDEFWHAHILDTRAYMRDCEAIFGHYLHHAPSYGQADRKRSQKHFEQTEKLFENEFGVPFVFNRVGEIKCSKDNCSHQCKVGDNCDKDCGKPCKADNPSPPSGN